MKANQNESLGTGAPSQSGDIGETASDREKANAAATPDRLNEAAPQHADAGAEIGNAARDDPSLDRGMASPGAASQADASARHASENLPAAGRTPKR